MKNRFSTVLRMLALSLLLACPLVMLTSCGDDEPKSMVIDYYLNVEEGFLVNGSIDQTSPLLVEFKIVVEILVIFALVYVFLYDVVRQRQVHGKACQVNKCNESHMFFKRPVLEWSFHFSSPLWSILCLCSFYNIGEKK